MSFDGFLKADATADIHLGPFVDTSGSVQTGLTVSASSVWVALNGAVFRTKRDLTNGTHDQIGFYRTQLNPDDVSAAGTLKVATNISGALLVEQNYQVLAADVYDAHYADAGKALSPTAVLNIENAFMGNAGTSMRLDSLLVQPSASEVAAVQIIGAGLGSGLYVEGGPNGVGAQFLGGSAAGNAITINSPTADGVFIDANNYAAVLQNATGNLIQYVVTSGDIYDYASVNGDPNIYANVQQVASATAVATAEVNFDNIATANASAIVQNAINSLIDLSTADVSAVVQTALTTTVVDVDIKSIDSNSAAAANLAIVYDGNEGFMSAYDGPRGPGVYLNDAAANTNTANGVDGTLVNPVSTIAAAKTLADAMSIDRIYLVNDSSITLGATMTDYEFVGIGAHDGNAIALASQDISNSTIVNCTVTGVQGGAGRATYVGCYFGTATVHALALHCGFTDGATGVTLSNNDDNFFDSCFSLVAGNAAPILICSAANLDLGIRHYSGGFQINTLNATATVSIETDGQVIFNADCNTGAAVTIRGNATITDNTAGMSNLTDGARFSIRNVWDTLQADYTVTGSFGYYLDSNVSSAVAAASPLSTADTSAVVQLALTNYPVPVITDISANTQTVVNTLIDLSTADVSAVVQTSLNTTVVSADVKEVDSNSAAAANLSQSALGIITGTAQTGTLSTTQCTSDLTGYADDELINRTIVFNSGTANGQASTIIDYASASGLITYDTITTAPANADTFVIV